MLYKNSIYIAPLQKDSFYTSKGLLFNLNLFYTNKTKNNS